MQIENHEGNLGSDSVTPESLGAARMDPAIKAKWVAALRSGEYKQGTACLRDGDGWFCCLGVLCDLYAKAAGLEWQATNSAVYGVRMHLPDAGIYYPPDFVREWAGFHEDVHRVVIGGHNLSVAVHNDGTMDKTRTFAEIANAIEAQL